MRHGGQASPCDFAVASLSWAMSKGSGRTGPWMTNAQAERDEAYARELRELHERHRALEREKQPILQRLKDLRDAQSCKPAG